MATKRSAGASGLVLDEPAVEQIEAAVPAALEKALPPAIEEAVPAAVPAALDEAVPKAVPAAVDEAVPDAIPAAVDHAVPRAVPDAFADAIPDLEAVLERSSPADSANPSVSPVVLESSLDNLSAELVKEVRSTCSPILTQLEPVATDEPVTQLSPEVRDLSSPVSRLVPLVEDLPASALPTDA